MEGKFVVSSSPHLRDSVNTKKIMLDVIIALIPAMVFSIYYFGMDALRIIIISVLTCILCEFVIRKIFNRENTTYDLSAVVTGILLALNFSAAVPFWIPIIGGIIAIILVKQLFGGIGANFLNPALAARVMLFISWPRALNTWVKPHIDMVTSATPLELIKSSNITELPSYNDLFIGNVAGCIGETSVFALLLGGIYLLYKKVISYHIPFYYIISVGLVSWIFGGNQLFNGDYMYHILSGGLFLGAIYMATDYSTSPMTKNGKIIMGVGCGILTAIIRLYTPLPEGVSFAILFMNLFVPLIDRYFVPKSFGGAINNG